MYNQYAFDRSIKLDNTLSVKILHYFCYNIQLILLHLF